MRYHWFSYKPITHIAIRMNHRTISRRGRVNTAEELSTYLLSSLGENLKQAVKSCVEVCVRAEMETLRSEAGDHLVFNGSYDRNLVSMLGKQSVSIPRFRTGNRAHTIQALSVFEEERASFEELVSYLHLAGISQRKIDKLGKLIFKKAVPPQTTQRVYAELMEQEVFRVNDRSLIGLSFDYLYADGIWFSSLGTLSKHKKDRVVLCIMGYSKERDETAFLGFLIAESESAENWKSLFVSLKKRGFDIERIPLLVADDGAGLLSAVEDIAPSVPVQVCIAHRYRNVLAHTSRRAKRAMADDLKLLTTCRTREAAFSHVKMMEKKWHTTEARAMTSLTWNLSSSFTYFDFPEEDWKRIRTTNKLERSFREVRRRTVIADNHFQSDASAERYVAGALGWRTLAALQN